MVRQVDLAQVLADAFGALDAGRTDDAKRLTRTVERLRPDLPGLAYLRGLLALAEGQGRKAAQHLAKALAQTPDVPPLLLAMARAQAMQGRHTVAETLYRRLMQLLPDLADAYDELGEILLRQEQYGPAGVLLRRANILHPGQARGLNNLGVVERALGHWEAAALAFAQAIDADGSSAKAYANLAGVLRRRKRPEEAVDLARQATVLDPDDATNWLELGQAERDGGDLPAALTAFTAAIDRDFSLLEALWLQGECLAAMGRSAEAADVLRLLLVRDPDDRFGAELALARLTGVSSPTAASAAFVRTLFDQYADSFDHDLVDGLDYHGPEMLVAAIVRSLGRGPFDCFDAGCGTGLAGVALKPFVRRLDGVDLSPRMAAKAAERGIYDAVEAGDMVGALAGRPVTYDLVVAADVLIYLGDLAPLFRAAAGALRAGGGFVFTAESHPGEGSLLQESRRFAHSESCLRQLAAMAGFRPLLMENTSVRHDRGQPVPGLLAVLKKD
ncbi:tetratricopeptide repeat protein [Telmatospirillum sp.]|uniref:tetratricopeptide repeat protein n=1 Tax=Telmatospirillum sp. TaxID=2079197 RepID=UPI002846FE7A|nr:tetratricopeptide repeat protein [Telmatospirillum sp.]MDR3438434.1 tetratricopeptide repeat protein [Telmatospirillum sp.]